MLTRSGAETRMVRVIRIDSMVLNVQKPEGTVQTVQVINARANGRDIWYWW